MIDAYDFEEMIKPKKEYEIKVYQHGRMWVVQDDKYIATGMSKDEAFDHFKVIFNREYEKLKKQVEKDLKESRERHRKLWNY